MERWLIRVESQHWRSHGDAGDRSPYAGTGRGICAKPAEENFEVTWAKRIGYVNVWKTPWRFFLLLFCYPETFSLKNVDATPTRKSYSGILTTPLRLREFAENKKMRFLKENTLTNVYSFVRTYTVEPIKNISVWYSDIFTLEIGKHQSCGGRDG